MIDLDLKNKRVLIRVDFNVPMDAGKITSDARIRASIPTIKKALRSGAAVILLSHLGRPKEGVYEEDLSLAPVAKRLSQLLGESVRFEKNWLDGIDITSGQVVLCENVRFNVGEKKNDDMLAKKMAKLCDIFINDAFATAHRAEASTSGVAKYAKEKAAGLLLSQELEALSKAIQKPKRPLVAIMGGAKISTKLGVLQAILDFSDNLIVGGGIANTLLASAGFEIGRSLCEPELIEEGKKIIALAKEKKVYMPLPTDVVVSKKIASDAATVIKKVSEIAPDDMIVDIGPETVDQFTAIIKKAKTILWNGPVGAFEIDAFAKGTKAIADAVAKSDAYSVAGGGDTIAALEKFHLESKVSYISTGGGAFLEYLETAQKGKQLPAVESLNQ
ncbi:MAG: phosphoglycerate kinase [Gammaproteobacteria bacterium]|nr:phosphoglycerate kinase [Gammaproteobacteria bacterium]